VYLDPRAYTSLFFMILALVTGCVYFTIAVVGISVSLGLAVLIIGVPFFLAFIGIVRVISLGEGRLLEAMTGERMPRRPVHPGPPMTFRARIIEMLKERRTWTTLAYFILMLPLGIVYFVIAIVGLAFGLGLTLALPFGVLNHLGVIPGSFQPEWVGVTPVLAVISIIGIFIFTALMHTARGIGRIHVRIAKQFLVTQG
jgi:Putative sensor